MNVVIGWSLLWIVMDSGLIPKNKVELLHNEANELTSIFVSAIKTSKSKS